MDPSKRPSFSQSYARLASVMPPLVRVECTCDDDDKLKASVGDFIAVVDGK